MNTYQTLKGNPGENRPLMPAWRVWTVLLHAVNHSLRADNGWVLGSSWVPTPPVTPAQLCILWLSSVIASFPSVSYVLLSCHKIAKDSNSSRQDDNYTFVIRGLKPASHFLLYFPVFLVISCSLYTLQVNYECDLMQNHQLKTLWDFSLIFFSWWHDSWTWHLYVTTLWNLSKGWTHPQNLT